MEIVKCSGCGKSYLEAGLIEVRDRGDCFTALVWIAHGKLHEVCVSITVAKESPLVKSLVAKRSEGIGRYCVGCLGPILMLALGKALNHTQVQAFHTSECEGECPT